MQSSQFNVRLSCLNYGLSLEPIARFFFFVFLEIGELGERKLAGEFVASTCFYLLQMVLATRGREAWSPGSFCESAS